MNKRKDGFIVPPLSAKAIALAAGAVRKGLGLQAVKHLPIVTVYEALGFIHEHGKFQVLEDHEMGPDDGRTYPDAGLILLRQTVYDSAANGDGRSRFTMCHELGHLVLHRGAGALARVNPNAPHRIYQNSEWQADVFASFLMMPTELLESYWSVQQVVSDFGVSQAAAVTRLNAIKRGR